ncbi:MAG: hypothetical protein ACE366_07135 [Bradymonadia bacterium]
MSFAQLIAEGATIEAMAELLDGLDHDGRVQAIRAVGGKSQKALWQRAEGHVAQMHDIVPPDVPPLTPVRHFGKNSLPLFSHFEKRFCRPAEDADVWWGYNHQPNAWITGPGYFFCKASEAAERGAVVVDYHHVPPAGAPLPEGWPAPKPNDKGLSRPVYGFMEDYLRRVSAHVTIGRAWRHGKATGNYFILCRES